MEIFDNRNHLGNYQLDLRRDYKPRPRGKHGVGAFTFENARSENAVKASQLWFGDNLIRPSEISEVRDIQFSLSDAIKGSGVSRSLLNTEQLFNGCKRVSWSSSSLGSRFKKVLAGLPVKLIQSPQDNSVEIILLRESLSDGRNFAIMGEIWRNSATGKDFIYWFFDAIVHTRPGLSKMSINPSDTYFLPNLFQTCVYLAETQLPSSPSISPSRLEVFHVKNKSELPFLALHTESNYYHVGFTKENESQFYWTPETTRFGYVFDDSKNIEKIGSSSNIIKQAIYKIADILVDGYCNNSSYSANSFQNTCLPQWSLIDEAEVWHFEKNHFIPGPIYVELELNTFSLYAKSQELAHQGIQGKNLELLLTGLNGYLEIISKGVGATFVHAINSYVYTLSMASKNLLNMDSESLKGLRDYAIALLSFASRLPVDLQDANACSNWALIEVSANNFQSAVDAVNLGIAKLKENRVNLPPSAIGSSIVEENPGIKLELFATKAEILYRHGQTMKAKQIAQDVVAEAQQLGVSGPEIEKAKWIVSH